MIEPMQYIYTPGEPHELPVAGVEQGWLIIAEDGAKAGKRATCIPYALLHDGSGNVTGVPTGEATEASIVDDTQPPS